MQDIDDYISSIIGNRKISEELGKWLIKKSQYVRKRIVLTLPVSNRQGIFLPISEQKNLKKDKKSVKIRTIVLKIENTNKSIQTGNNNHRRIPLFFTSEKPKMFFLKS